MDYLQHAFHLLILVFWVRLWSVSSKELHFNPFLSGTVRATDAVLAFLRPVLFLPEQAAALAVLLFTLLFKTMVFWKFFGGFGGGWSISIGMLFDFAPRIADGQLAPLFLFSVLQAAAFIIRLWTVYLLVRLITPTGRVTRATDALAYFARPFSRLPLLAQPFVLLALHAMLAVILTHTCTLDIARPLQETAGQTVPAASPFLTGPFYVQSMKIGWLAAISFADGLKLLMNALLVLILCNIAAMLLQLRGTSIVTSEGIEMLLGRFARRNPSAMGIDFTPLIFIFVVNLAYGNVCQVFYTLINSPFLN